MGRNELAAAYDALFAYLSGGLDVEACAARFAALSHQTTVDATDDADRLVSNVRLLLAEWGRGDRSDGELRDALRRLVEATYWMYSGPSAQRDHSITQRTGAAYAIRTAEAVIPALAGPPGPPGLPGVDDASL